MSIPTFRHPDKFQVLSHREWIRDKCPTGSSGFVAEDLDLVVRTYGYGYGTDTLGQIMLCELKFCSCTLGRAQRMTFKLLDTLCRGNDPENRYKGYFLVQYPDEDWYKCDRFVVNNVHLSPDDFQRFLCFDKAILDRLAREGIDPLG